MSSFKKTDHEKTFYIFIFIYYFYSPWKMNFEKCGCKHFIIYNTDYVC